MRIVLTGGNGFIGSAFVARNSLNAEIITVGRAPARSGASRHVSVDLAKPGQLEDAIASGRLPDRADVIVHLAVSRHHRTFPETALDMFQVNVAATAALLDYAYRAKARHVVLGSTGTVYHPFPKEIHGEEDVTRPGSYFGLSKLIAEDMARLYAPQNFDLFVPRFFTPYGPGQSDRLVDGLIKRVTNGEPVLIPLEGRGIVSAPIYLDDAVLVLEEAIRHCWSGIYNVAGDEIVALQDMAEIIGRVVGRNPVIERTPQASGATLVPNISRLKKLISTSNFVSFEEGIRRIVASA